MGLDGTTYELVISYGQTDATYRWWEAPPAGWEPLLELVTAIYRLASRTRVLLPVVGRVKPPVATRVF